MKTDHRLPFTDHRFSMPVFPGSPRKNDGLFLYGAINPKPWVYAYCQESVEVVRGPSCTLENEVHLSRCEADGVPVLSRRGGGGAVVLSPGMVVVVVVGKPGAADGIRDIFSRIHRATIRLLDPNGALGITEQGLSDLAMGGRKILGSSLYLPQKPRLYYYQSSMMVDPDLSLLTRYLTHPPKEPAYRHGRSHGDFCASLRAAGCRLTAEEIRDLLSGRLGAMLG
jgi:lipoate-protein ligase A